MLAAGTASVFTQEALLFSQSAVVSFGGAYAALAHVAQQAVGAYGWLRPAEMLTGLGLAETTPGPLIMVVQFVGFMAAYRSPGPFTPLTAGVLGSALTTWVTFAPCFCLIFAGSPVIERCRRPPLTDRRAVGDHRRRRRRGGRPRGLVHRPHRVRPGRLGAPLGLRLLVPDPASVDLAAVAITTLAALAIFKLKLAVLKTLGLCAALGLLTALATGKGT